MRPNLRPCFLLTVVLALLAPAESRATSYTYKVKHLHAVGGCQGQLTVSETDVRYESDYRVDSRIWTYDQIKESRRTDVDKLTIFTYEDQALQFGRDKPFDFEFLDGSVSDELLNFIITRLGRARPLQPPATPPGGRYELKAKHDHMFGGCEGTLRITESHIEYVSPRSRDTRTWKYSDIKRIERRSSYRLDIHTYEDVGWQFGRDKVFHFELKDALEPVVYEYIRRKMNP
jgi:hypothetical protein